MECFSWFTNCEAVENNFPCCQLNVDGKIIKQGYQGEVVAMYMREIAVGN